MKAMVFGWLKTSVTGLARSKGFFQDPKLFLYGSGSFVKPAELCNYWSSLAALFNLCTDTGHMNWKRLCRRLRLTWKKLVISISKTLNPELLKYVVVL